MFDKILRIGTRDSQLALWQARKVSFLLESHSLQTELVSTKTVGDLNLTQPIYALGIQGVFTKALDVALLEHQIDIAVHSLKDVPTQLPEGLSLAAVLERGSSKDILVQNQAADLQLPSVIATGSLRRKAQWLHRYPNHRIVGLRGNVQTRMDKWSSSNWQGAIFAKAGLERVDLLRPHFLDLDWMIPAPAQGAIGVVCRKTETSIIEQLQKINHPSTQICVAIERELLRIVEGGCSAPIGAHARVEDHKIKLDAGIFSLDGQTAVTTQTEAEIEDWETMAPLSAHELLTKGGAHIMESIKYSKK